MELLALRQEAPFTSIYVTHDQLEAMTLGDRVVVMRAGRIEQVGSPEERLPSAAHPLRRRLRRHSQRARRHRARRQRRRGRCRHRHRPPEDPGLARRAGGGVALRGRGSSDPDRPGAGGGTRRAEGRVIRSVFQGTARLDLVGRPGNADRDRIVRRGAPGARHRGDGATRAGSSVRAPRRLIGAQSMRHLGMRP